MTTAVAPQKRMEVSATRLPRLGFVGTGWIGRLRMEALVRQSCAELCAVHDTCPKAAEAAAQLHAGTVVHSSFRDLLEQDLDGVVIATPSALHAAQCEAALWAGKAVFCQKPLARTARETRCIIETAKRVNCRLEIDFSYRHLAGMDRLRHHIRGGDLGEIFAVDLVFHNAYGPDKPWFYDINSSGGGCIMDLGTHLVDLALWLLPSTPAFGVTSCLVRSGKRLATPHEQVEDYGRASFRLGNAEVNLCCSWNLHAGQDAVIGATFYGTEGGARLANVGGSFYDFEIHRFRGTIREKISGYPDDWGGRALAAWTRELRQDPTFDARIEHAQRVAEVIDRIYER